MLPATTSSLASRSLNFRGLTSTTRICPSVLKSSSNLPVPVPLPSVSGRTIYTSSPILKAQSTPNPLHAPKPVQGFVGAIGNTPLVRINSLSDKCGSEILAKAEWVQPGGSVKDRAALFVVKDAEEKGEFHHQSISSSPLLTSQESRRLLCPSSLGLWKEESTSSTSPILFFSDLLKPLEFGSMNPS